MTFSLSPDHASFVESSVAAGKYPSPEAMIAAGIELLRKRQEYDDYVRRELQIGLDELERGEGRTFESMDEFESFLETMLEESLQRADAKRQSA